MTFSIAFDYRFDTTGFFSDPERRAALEDAASQWERVIQDEFDDIPAGTVLDIRDPVTSDIVDVTLSQPIDDVLIFVGARDLPGNVLGHAGPDGFNAGGDMHTARISSDFRGTGPTTDFEPWAGTIAFDDETNWFFGDGVQSGNQSSFQSVAAHEIGHVLGFGVTETFDRWIVNNVFTGPNAQSVTGGQGVPLEGDHAHVSEGYAGNDVLMDPYLTVGDSVTVSEIDKAILADLGYEIAGFTKQGVTPAIATNGAERIFGSSTNDTINGLAGNDSLQGDAGDDVLRGGPGDDVLFGQAGADVFVIGLGDGNNDLPDFEIARDKIRLIDSGFETAEDAVAAVTKSASNVSRLTLSDGTTVNVFHGVQSGTALTKTHFELANEIDETPTNPDPTEPSVPIEPGVPGPDPTIAPEGDLFVVTADTDTVQGGTGIDTAVFGGSQTHYTLSISASGIQVTDRRDEGFGTVELQNIERVAFEAPVPDSDEPVDLRLFGGHTGLSQDDLESFIEMYIAYFDRAPDALGLSFWGSAYANGTSLENIARLFNDQDETRDMYPDTLSNVRVVADVYDNVLGRAPDIDGLRFWTDVLDSGAVSRDAFILEILEGVDASPPVGASPSFLDRQLADQAYLAMKTDIGALFAVHRGLSDVQDAADVMALFDGTVESFQAAIAAIEADYSEAVSPEFGEFLMPLIGVLDEPLLG